MATTGTRKVVQNHPDCPDGQPHAIVDEHGHVISCHADAKKAQDLALTMNIPDATPAPGGGTADSPGVTAPSAAAAEDADGEPPPLATWPGIELVAVGEWPLSTGLASFTADDLRAACAAARCPSVGNPVIKLGHHDPRFDGEPAIGWVANMRTNDTQTKILGDLTGMPPWLGGILPSAYPARSVEGCWNFTCQQGHVHPFVITGLALLGTTPPGVGTIASLNDIATLYGIEVPAAPAPADAAAARPFTLALGAAMPPQAGSNPAVAEATGTVTTVDDIRREFYEKAPFSQWIVELQFGAAGPALIIVDDATGELYRVPVTLDPKNPGDVSFGDATAVLVSYVDAPGDGQAAASAELAFPPGRTVAAAWGSRAASRGPFTATWDGAAAVSAMGDEPSAAAIKKMFALPADTKSASKLPHHECSDGTVGEANLQACSAAIGAINGGRGGLTDVGETDKKSAYNHLAAHITAAGNEAPEYTGSAEANPLAGIKNWPVVDETGEAEAGAGDGNGRDGEGQVQAAMTDCPQCDGSGDCPTCDGSGKVAASADGQARAASMTDCPDCDGSGDCPNCNGSGKVPASASRTAAERLAWLAGKAAKIRAALGDDPSTNQMVASLDATLDQANDLAASVDRTTVPEAAGQILDLVGAAWALVDQLMDALNIYDPDDDDNAPDAVSAEAGVRLYEVEGAVTHGAMEGEHDHPHSAFGSQGSDKTHSHMHSHQNDAVHKHVHGALSSAAPPAPAAASPEGGGSSDMEFTPDQLAAIRRRLGKKPDEDVTPAEIAATYAAPPAPVAGSVRTDGSVEVPTIGDGAYLVDADILREYQQRALAGDHAVRQLHIAERDQVLAAAIREGKFPQARLEHYAAMWDKDPDGTREYVARMAGNLVPMGGPLGNNPGFDPDMPGDFEQQQAYKDLYPEDISGGVASAPGVRGGARRG